MKTTKRFLAGLFALTMCMGVASCGSGSGNDADASSGKHIEMDQADKDALSEIAKEQLDTTELENKEVIFLGSWNINPSEGQVVGPDIQMFWDTYDGYFTWIETTYQDRYEKLAARVMANDSPDFFSAMDMDAFPKGAIKGMFDPIDDYIDLDSDLWAPAKSTVDSFKFKGSHYVAGTQAVPDYVCIYNKTTIEDNGLDDPAELYWADEWTFSKFAEMCDDFTFVDPEQQIEHYGLDGWWYEAALNNICGVPLITLEDDKLVSNLGDPEVAKIQNLLYDDLQKKDVCFDRSFNERWDTRGDGVTGRGMGTYETLFIPVGLWAIENSPENVEPFGDVEAGEIMFVPMPRMDDKDEYYVTARVDGFLLCRNAPNPEGFAAYMNCRMATLNAANDISTKQLKEEYKWNDEMIEMREEVIRLCNEHPLYDFQEGVSDEVTSNMLQVKQSTLGTNANPQPWGTVVSEYQNAIDFMLEDANASIG